MTLCLEHTFWYDEFNLVSFTFKDLFLFYSIFPYIFVHLEIFGVWSEFEDYEVLFEISDFLT